MQKELLLAIGDDRAASYNLRFLKSLYDNICDLKLTLFYAAPRMASWDMHENTMIPKGDALDQIMEHKKTKGHKALKEAETWLKDMTGCPGDNVITKVIHSKKGTAHELIDEARSGLYDALILGRKTASWFEEIFNNSVCHELIWQDIDFPIWICKRPPDVPHENILLCADGSEASLRIIDHAGFMLADQPAQGFTLFHVGRDEYEAKHIFANATAALTDNNVSIERIQAKQVPGGDVVKAILKEVSTHKYAAVGVGRRGTTIRSKRENMFPTSVSVKLLRQLTDTALWISK